MRDRFLKQTKREYSPRQRMALLAVAGVLFLIILPLALIHLGGRLDRGGLAGLPLPTGECHRREVMTPAPVGAAAGAGVATQK